MHLTPVASLPVRCRLVCTSIASLLICTAAAAAADRPNILLLLSDDHSYPFVSTYGNTSISTPVPMP